MLMLNSNNKGMVQEFNRLWDLFTSGAICARQLAALLEDNSVLSTHVKNDMLTWAAQEEAL